MEVWPFWQRAARRAKAKEYRDHYARWADAGLPKETKAKIKQAAEVARTLKKQRMALQKDLQATRVVEDFSEAFYGAAKTDVDKPYGSGGTTRTKTCTGSQAGGEPTAGDYVKLDMMCLCAKHSDDATNGDKACCQTCDTGNSNNWDPKAKETTAWKQFKQQCPKRLGKGALTPEIIESTLSNFLHSISKGKGTNKDKLHVLGTTDNSFDNDCDGSSDVGKGKCAQYKADYFKTGDIQIPWVKKLREAAKNLRAQRAVAAKLAALGHAALLLNLTTNQLIHDKQLSSAPETRTNVAAAAAVVSNCNKHGTNETYGITVKMERN
uniref:Variant surface glycoprotein 1125.5369 n=1 Tax=Trypanosoma brucei TaxID=5691 RepID=A0A1J0RCI0_9TRYP|nr:variant surface glycoprotein 1125.5369 [Trypanosoma brucei]